MKHHRLFRIPGSLPALHPHRVFLLIGLISGLLMVFLTPPFQAPDEYSHFYRAYHISEGHPKACKADQRVGAELPKSLKKLLMFNHLPFNTEARADRQLFRQALEIELQPEDRTFVDFNNTALMSPLPYLPEALVIAMGRMARTRPIILVYAGRLTNLLTWLLLIVMAIKVVPVGKWLLAVLALMPMCIFLAASLSYDAFTTGLAFLATAFLLRMMLAPEGTVCWRDAVVVCLLGMGLALSKFAYTGLILLWLLVPGKRFASGRTRLLMTAAILLATAVALIGWSLVAEGLYLTYEQYHPRHRDIQALKPGVDPQSQLDLLLRSPVQFLGRYAQSMASRRVCYSFIATLGWMDTPFPNWYIRGYFLLLLGVALTDGCKAIGMSLRQRLGMLAVLTGCVVFFGTLLYVQWNPVDAPRIAGLQGRYFIPLSPTLFFIFYAGNHITAINRLSLNLVLTVILAGSQVFTICTIIQRYYGWFG